MPGAQFTDASADAPLSTDTYMAERGNDDPLTHLKKQRAMTLERLRKRAPDLVDQLEGWERAIDALQPGTKYARHLSGAEALAEYLHEHGPTKRLDAIKAVASSGWAYDREDPIGILHDAVDYQLGKSTNPKIISLENDLIGLPGHAPEKRRRDKAR